MDPITLELTYSKETKSAVLYGINQRPNSAFVGLYLLKTDLSRACHNGETTPVNIRVTVEAIEP